MVRVDALEAVQTLLNIERTDTVLVTDAEFPTGGLPGAVVAIAVDPFTGAPQSGGTGATVIPLVSAEFGVDAGRPRTLAIAPTGTEAFVYATDRLLGDGLVVVNLTQLQVQDFIPLAYPSLSGATSYSSGQSRPPLVFSRDGRLLYVATGLEVRIVDVVNRKIVAGFEENLPSPFNSEAGQTATPLHDRLDTVAGHIATPGGNGKPGTSVSALEVSTDGKTLYIVVQTGAGGGAQPGFVVPVNVDLYSDARTADGLQSNLSPYS